jgi:hypothetical protein
VAQSTLSARAVARTVSTKLGRTVTDKQVRGWARDHIARFDKTKHPEYQGHAYTAAEVRVIVAGMVARAARRAAPESAPAPRRTRKAIAPAPTDA